jgi:hypothetical protein
VGVVHDLKEFAVMQDRVPAPELSCLNHYELDSCTG